MSAHSRRFQVFRAAVSGACGQSVAFILQMRVTLIGPDRVARATRSLWPDRELADKASVRLIPPKRDVVPVARRDAIDRIGKWAQERTLLHLS